MSSKMHERWANQIQALTGQGPNPDFDSDINELGLVLFALHRAESTLSPAEQVAFITIVTDGFQPPELMGRTLAAALHEMDPQGPQEMDPYSYEEIQDRMAMVLEIRIVMERIASDLPCEGNLDMALAAILGPLDETLDHMGPATLIIERDSFDEIMAAYHEGPYDVVVGDCKTWENSTQWPPRPLDTTAWWGWRKKTEPMVANILRGTSYDGPM